MSDEINQLGRNFFSQASNLLMVRTATIALTCQNKDMLSSFITEGKPSFDVPGVKHWKIKTVQPERFLGAEQPITVFLQAFSKSEQEVARTHANLDNKKIEHLHELVSPFIEIVLKNMLSYFANKERDGNFDATVRSYTYRPIIFNICRQMNTRSFLAQSCEQVIINHFVMLGYQLQDEIEQEEQEIRSNDKRLSPYYMRHGVFNKIT